MKRYMIIFTLLAGISMPTENQCAGWLDSSTTKWSAITAAVATSTYALYRGIQLIARRQAIRAFHAHSEQVIAEPKGVVTLFAHGLGADREHGHHYKEYDVFTKDPRVSPENQLHVFDFQDSSALPTQLPSCLAQDADINILKKEYDKLVAQGYQVNVHGVSRGASTIFNFLALYQPKNVRCAVLESPFDDLESIVQNKLIGINRIPLVRSMASSAVTALIPKLPVGLQNYRVFGVNPGDVAHKVPQEIPLLFISSKQDALIPHTSTQALVRARQRAGHTHCYSTVVENGPHANILNFQDGAKVAGTIQRFIADPQTDPVFIGLAS